MSRKESIIRKLKRIIGGIILIAGALVLVHFAFLLVAGLSLASSDEIFTTDNAKDEAREIFIVLAGIELTVSMVFLYVGYKTATGRKEELSDKLTTCPDCNNTVSKRAESCPHCGAPLVEDVANSTLVNANSEL